MMDKWTDRLSEYLDGELPPAEREAMEAHLMECPECGRTLQQLRLVVTRAGQVIDREPAQDLWGGIAERIERGEEEPELLQATSSPKRRVSFSIPQLAAASIVLMLMSAGTMYVMVNQDEAPAEFAAAPTPQPTPAQASVRAVTRNYDAAVTDLELALDRNRTQLDSSTVRIIEQNLAIIDRAIADARTALRQEPANPYLSRYLDDAMQRKVQLLKRATSVMRSQT